MHRWRRANGDVCSCIAPVYVTDNAHEGDEDMEMKTLTLKALEQPRGARHGDTNVSTGFKTLYTLKDMMENQQRLKQIQRHDRF